MHFLLIFEFDIVFFRYCAFFKDLEKLYFVTRHKKNVKIIKPKNFKTIVN